MSAELQLDKSDWKPVTFGDVVKEVRQSTKDPVADGIEHVVGLEHIEPECIHLQNWASIEEETTFTKTFRKGHVLFGRRRAYLKKAAQAQFDGICSGDITVMEANDNLLPGLLPFLVNNDKFFDYAVEHSAGGLSPRTKFKDLANYKFLLPPKDQQAKLAKLLWAADSQLQSSLALHIRLEKLYGARRELLCFGDASNGESVWHTRLKRDVPATSQFSRLGEHLSDIRYGTSKKSNPDKKGAQCVGIPHVLDENLNSEGAAFVELTEKEQCLIQLASNDILVVRTNGNPAYTGRSAIVPSDTELVFASYLIRLRANEVKFNPEFLIRYLQTQTIRRYFRRHATSSAGNYNINTEDIKGVPVPEIDISEQTSIANDLSVLEGKRINARTASISAGQLLKSLINQIF